MRKADYAALTEILRERVEHARTRVPAEPIKARHEFNTARDIAHACARRLNVDRVQFLTACGLTSD